MTREEKINETESAQSALMFKGKEIELLSDLEKQEKIMRRQAKACECVKIQKVPKNIKIRGCQIPREHYYRPKEILINPIHSSNQELARKDLKLGLAARFVAASGRSRENLLGLVKVDLGAIKNCFEESVIEPFGNDGLVSILFLHACFVLQFICDIVCDELTKFGISYGLEISIQ